MAIKPTSLITSSQPLSPLGRTARTILRRRASADGILEAFAGVTLLNAGLTFREAYVALLELRRHDLLVPIDSFSASTRARRYFLP